jgi:hypothetical protein
MAVKAMFLCLYRKLNLHTSFEMLRVLAVSRQTQCCFVTSATLFCLKQVSALFAIEIIITVFSAFVLGKYYAV